MARCSADRNNSCPLLAGLLFGRRQSGEQPGYAKMQAARRLLRRTHRAGNVKVETRILMCSSPRARTKYCSRRLSLPQTVLNPSLDENREGALSWQFHGRMGNLCSACLGGLYRSGNVVDENIRTHDRLLCLTHWGAHADLATMRQRCGAGIAQRGNWLAKGNSVYLGVGCANGPSGLAGQRNRSFFK